MPQMNARIHVGANGGVYVMRDVFDVDGKVVTCQYAQADTTRLCLVWTDCREGVDFCDIFPVVPSGKSWDEVRAEAKRKNSCRR